MLSFVVLTANAGSENKVLYEKAGFDGYLTKPITGDILEKEMYSLAIQAKVITSEFYTFIETKDKTLDPVNLSCRSRITKDGYLEISWSRLEFFSANGKNYKKSTRLTKGASSFSYPMKTFEKLPSWAKDKVIGFEKKFSVLREKANALSKCRRQIENYKKLAEKSLN